MTGATERLNWVDANQRHLSASVARLRWYLELSLYNRESATRDDLEPPPEPPAFHFEGAALEVLARLFGLTTFERDLLLLSAAAELDSGFGALLGKLNNDPARQQPNFSLALSALPGAHWSALNPAASLRRWKLLEVVNGATLTSSALRVDERVLHYLAGVNTLDARLLSDWLEAIGRAANVEASLTGEAKQRVLPAIQAALARTPIKGRITLSGYEGSELLVARLLIESGADLRYVGTACPKTAWSAADCQWLEAKGVQVQYRASLEQDLAAMREYQPQLVIGTTPVVQAAKQANTPSLYFTNLISARPLMGPAGRRLAGTGGQCCARQPGALRRDE